MELTDLRHFSHVARTGSFSLGARRSHVTTPAVSKAVQRLEAELEVKLFERTTRSVALTDVGQQLLHRCHRIFAEPESMRAKLEVHASVVRGDVRIAAMEVFSIELLPRALASLVSVHPDLRPLTYEMAPTKMERLLLDGQIEVAFTIGGGRRSGIDCEELGTSRPVLVCGRTHPLYGRKRVTQRQLETHPSVVPRIWGMEDEETLDQFPMKRSIGATIELLQMGIALTVEGAYLGYFPEISVRTALAAGTLHRLGGVRGARPFALRALTRQGAPARPAVRAIVDAVKEALQTRTA